MTAARARDAEHPEGRRRAAARLGPSTRPRTSAVLLLALGLTLAPPVLAQGTASAPCEQGGRHRDFDFWVGEWDVYATWETWFDGRYVRRP